MSSQKVLELKDKNTDSSSNKITNILTVENKCKTFSINNRRYLGNKFKLNFFIKKVIEEECGDFKTFADLFAGTGAVASMFQDKELIVNDILYSNFVCHEAWFGTEEISIRKVAEYINFYNAIDVIDENYMSKYYADTYFSKKVCQKIGFIREDIEKLFQNCMINSRERSALITSLLYAMDKIANTCGHYDAYRKKGDLTGKLKLLVPDIKINNKNNKIYNLDINMLVKFIDADVVYLDPPYNSRQYCDAYHLMENVAKWQKPEVFGVAKKMDRTELKSDYCTQKAVQAFEDLIKNIKAKYIVLSYNNMAEKGNDRSNAKISDEEIIRILEAKGEVKTFSESYKAFTTGKSLIEENKERLFVCKCKTIEEPKLIQSPLNYTGGKFRLMPQIRPLFPHNINTFVDLFCGGGNVGINANAKKIILNDKNKVIYHLFNTLKNLDKNVTFEIIEGIISKYGLSNQDKYGYDYYNCNSNDGLQKYNKNKYLQLRADFNVKKERDDYYFIMLYVLIVYSFNNQIRFNSKGEFNVPVGKRDFNKNMKTKLAKFIDRIKSSTFCCTNSDYKKFPIKKLDKDSFVYVDPPYLMTCATYNEQSAWKEKDEKELLKFLDRLHAQNIRFALSNVLRSKGKENKILINWLEKNAAKYKTIHLNYTYSNSNYQTKNKTSETDEVLIINY